MKVTLAATRSCPHCPHIENELNGMNIPYERVIFEDNPEYMIKYGLKKSPSVIVDDEVVFVGMPSLPELRKYLEEKQKEKR